MPDIGHGTTVALLNGSVYDSIGRITSLSVPSLSTDIVETSAMDSANGFKEFIKGLKDWGEMSFTTNADILTTGDTTNYYDKVKAAAISDSAGTWKVTFPNGVNLVFSALTSGFTINANPGELITTDVTLKITGDITWNAAA